MSAVTCEARGSASYVSEGSALVPRRPRLLDTVRDALRLRHYSRRTERAYVGWIRRYILFHAKRHPAEMGATEVSRFLSSLAVEGRVSASTQNQALAALLFLYGPVPGVDLPWLDDLVRAVRPARLPVVLSRDEVRVVMGVLLYGAGLRLLECARLRVKDLDFAAKQIVVRSGKGDRDRVTLLPAVVRPALERHLARVRAQHERDVRAGAGWVELPHALAQKYPNAGREWPWQWVFPATRTYIERTTGQRRRHHLHETVMQRAVHRAVREAGLTKPAVLPHAEALVRDASPRGRLRHSNRPGVAGTPRCQAHDDLHARPEPGTGGCALAAGWTGEGGRSASAEAGGTWRAIPCRGSQANTHGASVVERRKATGMTRRAPVVELGVLGIGLHAWSGFGRYTELSNSR